MPDPLVEQTLKPCPCCGSTKILAPDHEGAPVYCNSCGLRALSITAWNTRPALPSVTEGREEIARIVEKIGDFAHLGHNWDSYGGKRIEPETIGLAQAFAHWLPTPDHVTPLPHGGVGFRWSSADIDIDMKPDGEIEGVIPSDPATLAKADRILASLPSANMVETAYPVEERAFHVVRRGDGEDLSFVAQDRACLTSIPAADRDDAYNLSSSLNRVVRFHVERAVASTTPTDPSIKRIREALATFAFAKWPDEMHWPTWLENMQRVARSALAEHDA